MSILHSELYYCPDASRKESIRLGSLLFAKDTDGEGICSVGFYQADSEVLISAQKLSNDEFFDRIFQDFNGYIELVAKQAGASREMSQDQIALNFISQLPHNLQATKPEPWPPARVFAQAAQEGQAIRAFALC
jgi:hypothetical protein